RTPGLPDRFFPGRSRRADGNPSRLPELPDVVIAVRVAGSTRQHRPVRRLPHVEVVEPSIRGVPVVRMIFVPGFPVDHRPRRFEPVVLGGKLVVRHLPGSVTRLKEVDVQPFVVLEELPCPYATHLAVLLTLPHPSRIRA